MARQEDVMQELARNIQKKLGKEMGFALLAFDFGDGGRMNYVSNGEREDVVEAMKEFIKKTDGNWGTHRLDFETVNVELSTDQYKDIHLLLHNLIELTGAYSKENVIFRDMNESLGHIKTALEAPRG